MGKWSVKNRKRAQEASSPKAGTGKPILEYIAANSAFVDMLTARQTIYSASN